uniref:Heterogeneous nuclear ribonucleoprotein 1-like n=1 Tax=Tanacetum cinerariifolium TaxID=118510 RepID=A0A6L2JJA6_TANCI|nr:heterogeneous nuclear ribonucleoprotein 1-like [Tanacetum cinerariifolium]
MHDNVTHRTRGFGFITFETKHSVEDVMHKNFHELCGKLVEVKWAVPKKISRGGTTSGMREINFNNRHQQVGGYLVSGYGLSSVSPRVSWGPLPMPVYPAYLNGGHGLMVMVVNEYNGIVGPILNGIPSQLGGVVVDSNSLVSSGVLMDGNKNDVQNSVEG